MTAHVGDVLETVREGSFDHEGAEIGVFSGEGPDLFCRSGVADMKQGFVLRLDKKSNCVHHVADPDSVNGMAPDRGHKPLAKGQKSQHGNSLGWAGNAGEVWPHLIVEKGLG